MNYILLACCLANPRLSMLVDDAAKYYGINPILLHAVILTESNYNKNAVNKTARIKSYGLTQLTETTAQDVCGLTSKNIMIPVHNIYCGAKVLKKQLVRYKWNEAKALSAYNAGTYTTRNSVYAYKVQRHKEMLYLDHFVEVD